MPASTPALLPPFAGNIYSISDVNEDEDFGDFMFSSHSTSFFPYPTSTSTRLYAADEDNDEDWGDFVASQNGLYSFKTQSDSPSAYKIDPSPSSNVARVKQKGAIPLSIFGEEEKEDTVPMTIDGIGIFESQFGSHSIPTYSSPTTVTTRKLNDLIERLYEQDCIGGKEEEDDFDDASWEFKEAHSADVGVKDIKEVDWSMVGTDDLNISPYATENSNKISRDHNDHDTVVKMMDYSPLASNAQNMFEKAHIPFTGLSQILIKNGQNVDHQENYPVYIGENIDFDQVDWEFQNAAKTKRYENIASYESSQSLANDLNSNSLVDFYCKLKDESLTLIVHHLSVLKIPALCGVTPETKKIIEEIQVLYGNLEEMIVSKDACTSVKIASKLNQLLSMLRTSDFTFVDQQFHLSERLRAAEKELNAGMDLFKHSTVVLEIMRLGSKEHQQFYINAWSKLASACIEDLHLGAKIWVHSLNGCISKQILTKGNKHFIALGEVYRVTKILKATMRLYKSWLLPVMAESDAMFIFLESDQYTWISSVLEEVLESISSNIDLDDKGLAKSLLDSIKLIDKINETVFHSIAFGNRNTFCRFSLLPFDELPGINKVVWNGEWYITKIANFWANRITPDPPELPSLQKFW